MTDIFNVKPMYLNNSGQSNVEEQKSPDIVKIEGGLHEFWNEIQPNSKNKD